MSEQTEAALLTIYNQHITSSGKPPAIVANDPENYYGYFENDYGEQWVFVYDRKTGIGRLQGGDIEWGTVKTITAEVMSGTADTAVTQQAKAILGKIVVGDLILSPHERDWLDTCWRAATGLR